MRWCASSTTTASWYAHSPSARRITKSPTSRASDCAYGPTARSTKDTVTSGTRMRHARTFAGATAAREHVPG